MSHQVLIVRAGGQLYALPSEHVREITSPPPMTRLPGAPGDILGLANLRGQFFTVLDLAARLTGTPAAPADPDVVVLGVDGKTIGLLVEEVREVVTLDEVASESSIGRGEGSLVAGTGHFGEAVVIEVDVQALVRQVLA